MEGSIFSYRHSVFPHSAHRSKSSGIARRNWASLTALEPPVTLPRGMSISAWSVALAR